MKLTTRHGWLKEGLALLEEAGADALTIEALTGRLGVTKGSFYHHFANYQDFKESLLAFFEEQYTLRVIQEAEQAASAQEKLEHVIRASLHPSRLDVAIRSWALQDVQVHDIQQRVDQKRLAYLEELVYVQVDDHARAARIAQLYYIIYIGSQHIIPPIQGQALAQLYQEVFRVMREPSTNAEGSNSKP